MTVLIRNMSELKQGKTGSCYAIVRSMKTKKNWIDQFDLLSPSTELFLEHRRFKMDGQWNAKTFEDVFLPRFLHEMTGTAPIKAIEDIMNRSASGETIALACYCSDESLCHRSIIAGILQGMGCDVDTIGEADYSRYYGMWMECIEQEQ